MCRVWPEVCGHPEACTCSCMHLTGRPAWRKGITRLHKLGWNTEHTTREAVCVMMAL
jgi:hypothetical protein